MSPKIKQVGFFMDVIQSWSLAPLYSNYLTEQDRRVLQKKGIPEEPQFFCTSYDKWDKNLKDHYLLLRFGKIALVVTGALLFLAGVHVLSKAASIRIVAGIGQKEIHARHFQMLTGFFGYAGLSGLGGASFLSSYIIHQFENRSNGEKAKENLLKCIEFARQYKEEIFTNLTQNGHQATARRLRQFVNFYREFEVVELVNKAVFKKPSL